MEHTDFNLSDYDKSDDDDESDDDDDGETTLIEASKKGHTKTVEKLLAARADVNAKNNDGRDGSSLWQVEKDTQKQWQSYWRREQM